MKSFARLAVALSRTQAVCRCRSDAQLTVSRMNAASTPLFRKSEPLNGRARSQQPPSRPRVSSRGGGYAQVGVEGLIANPDPILVEESQRLLKQRRRWRTRRGCAIQNVEAILVHVDRDKGARLIGVGELYPMSFNAVRVAKRVIRHLGVPLNELRNGIVERVPNSGSLQPREMRSAKLPIRTGRRRDPMATTPAGRRSSTCAQSSSTRIVALRTVSGTGASVTSSSNNARNCSPQPTSARRATARPGSARSPIGIRPDNGTPMASSPVGH
jgi:hypothetical protein